MLNDPDEPTITMTEKPADVWWCELPEVEAGTTLVLLKNPVESDRPLYEFKLFPPGKRPRLRHVEVLTR